ncbi:MAG: hypothetical protein QGI83_09910, partial [Candidatus Latescibacteria bacterium]|nr:hypothetical protein [Candidatus Latescibacterota bacterium]
DLRETSAGLLLGEDLDGRFYVRNEKKQLIVELTKPAGRAVTIGLEPGTYDVHFEQPKALGLAKIELRDDEHVELDRKDFRSIDLKEAAALRGKRRGPRPTRLERRHRLQLHFGYAQGGSQQTQAGHVSTDGVMGGFLYGWWAREQVMVSLSFNGLASDVGVEVSSVANILFGVRYYFPKSSLRSTLRPYAVAAVGPAIASNVGIAVETEAAPSGYVGAGLDIPISRWFMIGTEFGYSLVSDFDLPLDGKRNYSGFQVNVGFSLTLGRGVGR